MESVLPLSRNGQGGRSTGMSFGERAFAIFMGALFLVPPVLGTIWVDKVLGLSKNMMQASDEGVYFFVLIILGVIWFHVLFGVIWVIQKIRDWK